MLHHSLAIISVGRHVGVNICRVPVTAVDHIQLAMPPGGEAQARAFYEGVLGIPEVVKPANAGFEMKTDEPLDGYARVYVDDPFGNRIELLERA